MVWLSSLLGLFVLLPLLQAFNVASNSNVVVYWGQNSNGAVNQGSRDQWEKPLAYYCKNMGPDVVILSFLISFNPMLLNFAYHCESTFPGSSLLSCPEIAQDIKVCQQMGKVVLLSLGGASGAYGFRSEEDGAAFADTLWDTFFKGRRRTNARPFGDAVLDGIDLDIEGGGSVGYTSMVKRLRELYATDRSKKYYVAAAPQCPFPDAYLQPVLNNAWFDMVFVQFYNNYCGVHRYPEAFNYGQWDQWAKAHALNKDVRLFIGVPGAPAAAQTGYVSPQRLASIVQSVRRTSSHFGGVMVWEASMAWANGFVQSLKSQLNRRALTNNPSWLQLRGANATAIVQGQPLPPLQVLDPPQLPLGDLFFAVEHLPSASMATVGLADLYEPRGPLDARVQFYQQHLDSGGFQMVVRVSSNMPTVPIHANWTMAFQLPSSVSVNSTSLPQWAYQASNLTIHGSPAQDPQQHMSLLFSVWGQGHASTDDMVHTIIRSMALVY
ncbi:Chitinase 2 [Dimargaris verticillata]|uniref:chitinase n=1 Tax=Dimargaris verticillata TaxID=2761393 RepID=A0A9W8BA23_9FUNG|nr:Chitinase 2 [Dimargaris verticillata]